MATYGVTDRLTGGTPTASGVSGGLVASAVDNNESTYWQLNAAVNGWYKYDCGAGVTWAFGKLRFKCHASLYIGDFTVQGSNDDSDYSTIYSGAGAATANWQEFTWSNKSKYRYIKINIVSAPGTNLIVYEFETMEMIFSLGGFSGGQPWIFLKDMWNKHKKLWTPKLILPKDLGFSY
jgi:hypothetical protein